MKINASLHIHKQDQTIEKLERDQEKAGEIFEKIFVQEMIKGMYKTTQFEEKENSMEDDFYQEQRIDILSDYIVKANVLKIKEKLFKE